jgi:hypothetical protein
MLMSWKQPKGGQMAYKLGSKSSNRRAAAAPPRPARSPLRDFVVTLEGEGAQAQVVVEAAHRLEALDTAEYLYPYMLAVEARPC